jgi:Tfp pilus assembly protein PilV
MMKRTQLVEPRPAAPASEAGFTLVEALVAVVVLVFGLIAVTNLFLVAGSSNFVASQGTAATTAATETMEALKATPFTALAVGGDVNADTGAFFRLDDVRGVGQINTRWQVTQLDGQTYFIRVRSESTAALTGARTRAEFTTFRSCTATSTGCPNP